MSRSKNEKSVINITKEIDIDSSLSRVWEVLVDINNWGRWNPSIDHAVIYGPFTQGARFKFSSGKWDFDSTIESLDVGRNVQFSCDTIGMCMRLSFNLQESNGQTNIKIETSVSGWLSRILKKALSRELEESVVTTVQSLKVIAIKKSGDDTKPA